jgi:tetratricopeptide (TPR) repeat protein
MRENAHERLVDEAAVRQRHCDYFAMRLAHVGQGAIGRAEVLQGIEAELEDIRAAWRHAAATGNRSALGAMALVLANFFNVKGRRSEGIALLREAARALGGTAPRGVAATLQHGLAVLHYRNGELALAEAAIGAAIRTYRALRQPGPLRECIYLRGAIASTRGDVASAQKSFEDALQLARTADDQAGSAKALNGLAACARSAGDYKRALTLQQQALQLQEAAGNVHEQAMLLNDVGVLLYTLRRYADAQRALTRGLALADLHGLASAREFCLFTLGMAEIELGQLDAARAHLQRSIEVEGASGAGLVSSAAHLGLARVCMRAGDAAAARVFLREALQRARSLASAPAQIYALGFVAEWLRGQGERQRAAALWSFIESHLSSEAADRDDATRALAQLELSAPEAAIAAQAASALELLALIDALIAEFF